MINQESLNVFDLTFRTLLSQVKRCERETWDWPKEVSKVFASYEPKQLAELNTILGVCRDTAVDVICGNYAVLQNLKNLEEAGCKALVTPIQS